MKLLLRYKLFIIAALIVLVFSGGFFYLYRQVYFSHGSNQASAIFSIESGEGNAGIADRLEKQGFIAGKYYFYYYVRKNNLINKIMPGEYELSGKMTIPEIAFVITREKKEDLKITFPEGWTSKKMAERLSKNGLDGDGFLQLVKKPDALVGQYVFLEKGKSLEGFLFPDTYFFKKDATAEMIAKKMLDTFDKKLSGDARAEIEKQKKSIYQIVTMASIIEGEVRSDEDRKIVSGLFWKRIKNGQALQSCATLAYLLGENKKQYSFEDTRIVSPYNTYLNKGLPPGPISNPGLSSIMAAVYPSASQYVYFLSDPETGKTIFSKTIDEHNANKVKYGL